VSKMAARTRGIVSVCCASTIMLQMASETQTKATSMRAGVRRSTDWNRWVVWATAFPSSDTEEGNAVETWKKVSPDTVMRDSRLAKAWLARELWGQKRV